MSNNVSYRDILRHRANHMSQTQIASACGCARSTVQDVLKRAGDKGISWEDVASLSEAAAYELVRGRPRDQLSDFAAINFEAVQKEMARDRTYALLAAPYSNRD